MNAIGNLYPGTPLTMRNKKMDNLIKTIETADTAALWAAVSGVTNAAYMTGTPSTDDKAFMVLYYVFAALIREIDKRMEADYEGGTGCD